MPFISGDSRRPSLRGWRRMPAERSERGSCERLGFGLHLFPARNTADYVKGEGYVNAIGERVVWLSGMIGCQWAATPCDVS